MGVDRSLLGLSEEELREKIKPTSTLNKLRLAFWYQYELCCAKRQRMNPLKVYAGICVKEYFWLQACTPMKLAWILTPVNTYETSLEEALEFAIGQIRKMIAAPLFRKDGSLDSAAANIVLQIYKTLDQRVHGAITQKVEMKKLVVSKSLGRDSVLTPGAAGLTLDQQIAEMEQKLLENRKIVEVPSGPTERQAVVQEYDEGTAKKEGS